MSRPRLLAAAGLLGAGLALAISWGPAPATGLAASPVEISLRAGDVPGFRPIPASIQTYREADDQGPAQAFIHCVRHTPLLDQFDSGPAATVGQVYGRGTDPFGTPVLSIASVVFTDGSPAHARAAYSKLARRSFQRCWAATQDALGRAQGLSVPVRPSTVSALAMPRLGAARTGFAIHYELAVLGRHVSGQFSASVIRSGAIVTMVITTAYDSSFPQARREVVLRRIAKRMGSGLPPPVASCGSPALTDGQPDRVVVLLDGVGSQEQGGTVYPLPEERGRPRVQSYCPLDRSGRERGAFNGGGRGWPAGVSAGLRRWSEFTVPGGASGGSGSSAVTAGQACDVPGGFSSGACLMARLADAGAVVLPFSYRGATLERSRRGPVFRFPSYSADDTKQQPQRSVDAVGGEVGSIHRTWPRARIVIVGHSYGGLVAELWWAQERSRRRDLWASYHVAHVFSLDSPINGVANCTLGVLGVGGNVGGLFCALWNQRDQLDRQILALDRDHSYTAVGAPNDPTYSGIPSGGGDLRAQLIYSCSDDGQDPHSSCIASPPSVVSPCDASTTLYGITHHDLVKVCPPIVGRIVEAARPRRFAALDRPASDRGTQPR